MKKIEDTSNIVHRTMMPQFPSKLAPWDLTRFSQCLFHCSRHCKILCWNRHQLTPWVFLNLNQQSEISSLSKVILVWEKPEVTGHQIWAIGGLSHLGDLMFHQKNARDVMYEQAHCHDEAANHQLSLAAAIFIMLHLSTDRGVYL